MTGKITNYDRLSDEQKAQFNNRDVKSIDLYIDLLNDLPIEIADELLDDYGAENLPFVVETKIGCFDKGDEKGVYSMLVGEISRGSPEAIVYCGKNEGGHLINLGFLYDNSCDRWMRDFVGWVEDLFNEIGLEKLYHVYVDMERFLDLCGREKVIQAGWDHFVTYRDHQGRTWFFDYTD